LEDAAPPVTQTRVLPPPLPVFRHCRYLTGKNLL
jgi:hypothetical protein